MVQRDQHPKFPGVDGFWFQIKDTNNQLLRIKVPSSDMEPVDVDRGNDRLGWCSMQAVGLNTSPYTTDVDSLKDGLIALTLGLPSFERYEVFQSNNSAKPLKDGAPLDLNKVGLLKNNPLIFKEMLRFWFRVVGENGNSVDLRDPALNFNWDDDAGDTDIAWLPFTGSYNAYQLKNLVIGHFSDQYPKKYEVYASDNSQTPIMGDRNVDLKTYGVKSSAPLNFRLILDYDDNNEDNESGSDEENTNEDNGDGTDEANTYDDANYSVDEYSSFTRQIQCTSNADWSRYPEAIQGTYPGEILWTDGNLAYGVANMMAYMVVRRDQTGRVIAAGRAPDQSAYFVLLG